MGGSTSSQVTQQTATTTNQSTTNANRSTSLNVNMEGLTGAQVTELVGTITQAQQQGQLYDLVRAGGAVISSGAQAVNSSAPSPIVVLAVLLIFAGLIFRGRS